MSDGTITRNWWREGWRIFGRTLAQFFTDQRRLGLALIVAAAAAAGWAVGWLTTFLVNNPNLTLPNLPLVLAAIFGAASVPITVGAWYLRDWKADGLSAAVPIPGIVAQLEQGPIPPGFVVDDDTKTLVVTVVRRKRRANTFGILVLLLFVAGVIVQQLVLLNTPGDEPRLTSLIQIVGGLVVAGTAVRTLARTTQLLAHTFAGNIPDVTVEPRPTRSADLT